MSRGGLRPGAGRKASKHGRGRAVTFYLKPDEEKRVKEFVGKIKKESKNDRQKKQAAYQTELAKLKDKYSV